MPTEDELRQIIKEWLEGILADQGWNEAQLTARVTGLDDGVIARGLGRRDPGKGVMSASTMSRISEAVGYPIPDLNARSWERLRTRIPEDFEPLSTLSPDDVKPRKKRETAPPQPLPDIFERRVKSRALDLMGILPGDLLTFQAAAAATSGQVVIAEIPGASTGSVRRILRRKAEHVLLVHSTDPIYAVFEPEPVGKGLKILGVMVQCTRRMLES